MDKKPKKAGNTERGVFALILGAEIILLIALFVMILTGYLEGIVNVVTSMVALLALTVIVAAISNRGKKSHESYIYFQRKISKK